MTDKDVIRSLVEKKLGNTDFFLVEICIKPENIIIIEIDSDNRVSIDDCVSLSRYIEENLDREKEDFELEVGSSGITSPFKVVRQYVKNIGNEVAVLLTKGVKLTGILKAANEKGITLTVEKKVKKEGAKRKETVQEDLIFSYNEIKETKYIIRF